MDPDPLPVRLHEGEIINAVLSHTIICIIAETGSGKSTQVARILSEMGLTKFGMIGITQPRRLAAVSLANHVAEEMRHSKETVSYQTRFENNLADSTSIKFMTDGILLKEIEEDFLLSKYSAIILDEVHEQRANTEILITLLTRMVKARMALYNSKKCPSPITLILMSATIGVDGSQFDNYIASLGASLIRIPGRMFRVSTYYSKSDSDDFILHAFKMVKKIASNLPPGDILVFLPGRREITSLYEMLLEKKVSNLRTYMLFGNMTPNLQAQIFENTTQRKCIIATNIAETSITIASVKYVVDSGRVKVKCFDCKDGSFSYSTQWISRSSAIQRAGRAGRTSAGYVYRLYTRNTFYEKFLPAEVPEICRIRLEGVLLLMAKLGLRDLANFKFISEIPKALIQTSLSSLMELGLIDSENQISEAGLFVSKLPCDVYLGKIIHAACQKEGHPFMMAGLILVAILSDDKHMEKCQVSKLMADSEVISMLQPTLISSLEDNDNLLQCIKQLFRILDYKEAQISEGLSYFNDNTEKFAKKMIRLMATVFKNNICMRHKTKIYTYTRIFDGQEIALDKKSFLAPKRPRFLLFYTFYNHKGKLIGRLPTRISKKTITKSFQHPRKLT